MIAVAYFTRSGVRIAVEVMATAGSGSAEALKRSDEVIERCEIIKINSKAGATDGRRGSRVPASRQWPPDPPRKAPKGNRSQAVPLWWDGGTLRELAE